MVYKIPKVLVTGGSGYIGLHIINQLLLKGYVVNTTTRDLNNEQAVPLHILKERYSNYLFLFEADLLIPGSFNKALEDVDAVFHVATPVLIGKVNDDPDKQIKPTVEGTNNILYSCLNFPKIKNIIITSSCVTVRDFSKEQTSVTESNFNPLSETHMDPYIKAKTLAERKTWEFHNIHKNRFRIVTLHPCVVFGPDFEIETHFNNRGNFGKNHIISIINGSDSGVILDKVMAVDVRDVAFAHIQALENEKAEGRFILFSQHITKCEIINLIRKYYPENSINPIMESESTLQPATYDNSKSIAILGLKYRSITESIKDTLIQLRSLSS